MNTKFQAVVFTLALSAYFSVSAFADPLPGEVLKFSQVPMINTLLPGDNGLVPYHGHDERSTAYSVRNDNGVITGYSGDFMADDFADKFSKPVVHVKWWGSYINRPSSVLDPTIRRFLISFERDVPAPSTDDGFSHPGEPLLNQIVSFDTDGVLTPGSGTFTEKPIPGSSGIDGPTYEYNAELNLGKAFPQKENTIYWLKIVALVETQPNTPVDQRVVWGWHNRDYTIPDPLASTPPAVVPGERIVGGLPGPGPSLIPIWHFQDDAVDGHVNVTLNPNNLIMPFVTQDVRGPQNYQPPFDGPSLIGTFSKDLAFQLYTVPEPTSGAMLLLGLIACLCKSRCRR